VNTVRTQLKSILAKTGATRQADLVRMVLTGPAIFNPPV
jgi:DNA-binding CsgD family transcriptional regulator